MRIKHAQQFYTLDYLADLKRDRLRLFLFLLLFIHLFIVAEDVLGDLGTALLSVVCLRRGRAAVILQSLRELREQGSDYI